MSTQLSEIKKLVKALEEQGCRIVRRRKGYMVFFPDGVTMAPLHTSNSDHRALKNFGSVVKGAGLEWPLNS